MKTPDPIHGSRTHASRRGYTLVEMVAVMVIVGILGSVASFVILQAMGVYSTALPIANAAYQAELATERLRSELRLLPDAASLTSWGNDSISFFDEGGNAVTYSLSGGTLLRNGSPLAEPVAGFDLQLLDRQGNPIGAAADLALVEIHLSLEAGNSQYPYRAAASPRALTP